MPSQKSYLKSTCLPQSISIGKTVQQKPVISTDNNELLRQNKIKSKDDSTTIA